MAVYLNGQSDVLEWTPTSFPISAIPFTLAAWANSITINDYKNVLSIADKDDNSYHAIRFDPYGNINLITKNESGNDFGFVHGAGYSTNTWYHIAGVFATASNRTLYQNASPSNDTNGINPEPNNLDCIEIGRSADSTPFGDVQHRVAEAAAWDVALTAAEIGILSAGYSPLFVRPQNLVMYLPLVRGVGERISGENPSSVSPEWYAHPPIIMPAPVFYSFPAVAGTTVPVGKQDLSLTLLAESILASRTWCWGHDTDVDEQATGDLADGSYTGALSGSGDSEKVAIEDGEYWESPTKFIGDGTFTIEPNKYQGAADFTVKYKTGTTESNCDAQIWTEGISFVSSGWAKIRIEH